jgi:hypothetical protein
MGVDLLVMRLACEVEWRFGVRWRFVCGRSIGC